MEGPESPYFSIAWRLLICIYNGPLWRAPKCPYYSRTHIGWIDVSSILRSGHTVHGLHLNPRGKIKLTRLTGETIKGRHIPVVMGVQNPFLG
jgi:hypothetical protein